VSDVQDPAPNRTELTGRTGRPVVLVRAAADGRVADALAVVPGRVVRDGHGRLAVRPGPGEWLLIGGDRPASAADSVAEIEKLAAGEFATAVDLTHGVALARLTGPAAAAVLSTLCALDLGDAAAPDGTSFRSLLAGVTAMVIRDDVDGVPSYLVQCDRSYGRYLTDAITDAIGGRAPVS
jgi:heterotetrameric sarcosine oxidase gamma subunit